MFGISMWEIGLILIVALIFLGPRQLAETARVLGRWYRELHRMSWEIRSSIDLDSITSSSPPPPRHETPSETPAPQLPEQPDQGTQPRDKLGPDFYAELLESSKEGDEKTAADAAGEAGQEKEEASEMPGARKTEK